MTRSLIVLGIVIGVSIAGEGAAISWSSLLLQTEAPKLAAIAGLGAALFCAFQAALRLNADRVRRLVSDQRLIVVSLAVAAFGFVVVAAHAGFRRHRVRLRHYRHRHRLRSCPAASRWRSGIAAFRRRAALSTVALFGALPRLPAPLAMGAIASYFSLSGAFALFAVLLAAGLRRHAVFRS